MQKKLSYLLIMSLNCDTLLAQKPKPELAERDAEFWEKKLRHRKVVISAQRSESRLADSVVQVEVITKEQIREKGARTVTEALNNETGFFIQRNFAGDNLQMQGLDSQYLLILRDGERLNGRINGQYDTGRLRVENIERIEIVRGSASAIYGSDAISGVVNIITARPKKPLVDARLQGGNLGAADATASAVVPLGDFVVRGSGAYRTQQPYRYDEKSVATLGRGINEYGFDSGAEWDFTKNWKLALQGDYSRRRLWGIDAPLSGGVFDRTNLTETAQGSFRLHTTSAANAANSSQAGESVSVARDDNKLENELKADRGKADFKINGSYTLFRDQLLYDQRNDTALDNYENTRENTYTLHAQAATPVLSLGRLTVGSEGIFENLQSPRIRPDTTHRHRIAGYSQFDSRLTDALIVSPGIRVDRDSQFGDYVSPRLGLKWGSEDFIMRASAGVGYRSPSFRELYLYFDNPSAGYTVQGNSTLQPENSRSANLGFEWFATKRISVDSNAYFNDLTNLIQTATAGAVGGVTQYQYRNVASAYTAGADNRIVFYLNRYLRATLGYSYTLAHDRGNDRSLEGRARHRGNAGLLFRYQGLTARLQFSLIDRRPYYMDISGQPPSRDPIFSAPYATVDVNAEYRLLSGLSVFAGGENLNSAGDATYLPLPPLRVYGGARYTFEE